ncbi:hypothetical protein [Pedobacter sp. NJ-S-72]
MFSCGRSEKNLDLETVDKYFDVSMFQHNHQKKLDRTNKIITTDPKTVDKKELLKQLDESMFMKDTLCFFYSEIYKRQIIDTKSSFIRRKKTPMQVYLDILMIPVPGTKMIVWPY